MEASQALHPTEMRLRAYAGGQLDDPSARSVQDHLMSCPDCRRRVAGLTADVVPGPIMSSTAGLSLLVAGGDGSSPPPRADTLPPGLADHPDYEVTRELGRGGMGVVYLARNRLMGRMEVLKVVGSHLIDRGGVLDRFLAEIRHAARLHHVNIVTAYTALRFGESLVLAMEYVEGLDLTKMVQARGPLPVAHACQYVQQAAMGLQHAHEHGMVHRDIKPSNLMLNRQGSRAAIKILDFGLAKVRSEGQVDAELTHEGQMLGTPAYIAPEQISNARRADIRADIYSLGCTLYYLLAGRPPFQGACLYDVLQAHHSMEAMPLNLKRPEVPVELAALVAKMMAKEPERRFQEPRDVARALTPFFKTGGLAFRSAEVETSHVGPSASRPPGPVVVRTPSGPANIDAGPAPSQPAMTPALASEPEWDRLIDRGEPERPRERPPAISSTGPPRWLWPTVAAGFLLLGLLVAWASVVRVKTSGGIIELVDLPRGANVFVDGDRVEVEWPGGGKPAVISVTPGKHTVRVKKDGFEVSGPELTVQAGGREEFIVQFAPTATSPDGRLAESTSDDQTARTTADQAPPGPGKPGAETIDKWPSPNTRIIYADEFNNNRRGLIKELNTPPKPNPGRSDGVFYFYAPHGVWRGWDMHHFDSDSTCEVVGRVSGDDPKRDGAWSVLVLNTAGLGRGIRVNINIKGELFVTPSPWPVARDFVAIDPRLGPITHPAIKPGHKDNRLRLIVRKREVVIMVNDVQVCGPVKLEYDLTPAKLQLGTDGPGNRWAEFDRVEIREILQPRDTPQVAEATQSVGPNTDNSSDLPKGISTAAGNEPPVPSPPANVGPPAENGSPPKVSNSKSSNVQASGDPATGDMDRRAAEAMKWLGGILTIVVNGRERLVPNEAVPKAAFQLTHVRLGNQPQLTAAGLEPLRGLRNLIELRLDHAPKLTDAGFAYLRNLPRIESLWLDGTGVTDAGLAHLSGLVTLHELVVRNTTLTDAGMIHLEGLTRLKLLGLGTSRVTDAGLVHLRHLPQLEQLWLEQTRVSDAGLEHLRGLTRLQNLLLWGTQVTDAGLVHLRGLTQLHRLLLGRTRVTDAGLVHLETLSNLESLWLDSTGVTDAGLVHLRRLTRLKELELTKTKVTATGVEALQKSLPTCRIVVDLPARESQVQKAAAPPVAEKNRIVDALQPGTIWIGENLVVPEGKTAPRRGVVTFTVQERRGDRFRAIWHSAQVRTIHGTIKDGQVRWFARDVEPVKGKQGPDMTGIIKGEEIFLKYSNGTTRLRLKK
jgi:serine/threonine protein kinase